MARESKIRLSSKEKDELDRVRDELYHTDEVPYGLVVETLITIYDGVEDADM